MWSLRHVCEFVARGNRSRMCGAAAAASWKPLQAIRNLALRLDLQKRANTPLAANAVARPLRGHAGRPPAVPSLLHLLLHSTMPSITSKQQNRWLHSGSLDAACAARSATCAA